jgi:hypothetical protein
MRPNEIGSHLNDVNVRINSNFIISLKFIMDTSEIYTEAEGV